MAVIKNNTARLYVINGVALVPGRTVEVALTREDIKDYPNFNSAVNAGLIEFIDDMPIDNTDNTNNDGNDGNTVDDVDANADKYQEVQKDFEDMTVSDLKKFASEKGIDLGTAVKKAEIIAVLKNA